MKKLLVIGALVLAAPAQGAVVESDGAFPYQRWVARAKAPVPSVTLTIVRGRCPWAPADDPYVSGCTQRDTTTIWLMADRGAQETKAALLHELGHQFDYRELDATEREWFMRTTRLSGEWRQEALGSHSPHELYADTYEKCALGSWRGRLGEAVDSPAVRNMRAACYVIRHSA